MSESGRPFATVFKIYQEAPVKVLTFKDVEAPEVKKPLTVVGKVVSSTRDGSAAPAIPEVDAGPDKPIVA